MAYTTIDKPSDYFNTVLYTGNGTLGNAITGVGFQPDFVWIKNRDAANSHTLHDVIRGVTKRIRTDSNAAEDTTDPFTSFDSDGFTLNSTGGGVNGNTEAYASWNWLADNTSGSSNSDGSITSTVAANTTSGFSICKLNVGNTTSTFGHGLNAVPKVVMAKSLSTGNWIVYHASIGAGKYLKLNTTDAEIANANMWQNTTPTSSLVYISGSEMAPNEDVIFYCFAEKKGFSKVGSYTGNGNTDGTFVYTGFKPAFLMVKPSSATGAWYIYDNKRAGYNVKNYQLFPSGNNVESTTDQVDLLSNGFKWRAITGDPNSSGRTYIYACFAENPFTTSTGIPTTAR